ncbi:MAG: exodeoxyribonuclease III [Myxococcota bacterium]
MRIATWNVNGLRARLDFVLQWLADRRPDVVGLQELKLSEDQFPREALEAAGYAAVCHAQKAWNGVAVLARGTTPRPLAVGLPGFEEMGARLLCAEVDGLEFTTIYCPNGKSLEHEDFARKLAWLDALADWLEPRVDETSRAVLCGDFNVCPSPLDSWNEEVLRGQIFHTDEERGRFARLLDAGWVDLFRARHPERRAFSWWDYRGGAFHRRQGLRIDFLLATAPLAATVSEVEIDREYRKKRDGRTPSDHAPVIADLALSGRRPAPPAERRPIPP